MADAAVHDSQDVDDILDPDNTASDVCEDIAIRKHHMRYADSPAFDSHLACGLYRLVEADPVTRNAVSVRSRIRSCFGWDRRWQASRKGSAFRRREA